ncbi:unnamed protein product [Protopolystoma xenopodis]|uniref:Uncharacterized protein n=1 Tax=Protopolystoma xenopodis TaxID=117903 RepID=A0A448XI45_9PLAT|nr:unnamed protein product [Protopolystoma xenopodis]
METSRGAIQAELANSERRLTEFEDVVRSKERAAAQASDDWQRDFRRLEDARQALEAKVSFAPDMRFHF